MPKRILLISRNLKFGDFYESMDSILDLALEKKADTLLFALFTLDYKYLLKESLRLKLIEYSRKYKKFIVLEFSDLSDYTGNIVVCFNNGKMKVFFQWFGKSVDNAFWKEALFGELPHRVFNKNELLLICGELNLGLKVNKKTNKVEDPYNFLGWLKKNDIKLIMDPFHDTAVRYEVNYKKRELSKNKRFVISVWNKNPRKHHNAITPWHLFYDGKNISDKIIELNASAMRSDIRIGILELKQ